MNNFAHCLSCTESADVFLQANGNAVRTPQLAEVKRVRNLFPETWIWLEYNARYNQQLFWFTSVGNPARKLLISWIFERISPASMLDTCACVISDDPSNGKLLGAGYVLTRAQNFCFALQFGVYLVTVLDWLVVAVYYLGQELFQHGDSNYLQHVTDTDFNYLLWKAHLTTSCTGANGNCAI